MAFTPRTTAPDGSEKWWKNDFNPFPVQNATAISLGCTIPNCTSYAFGRFAEIMNAYPSGMPTGNAGEWYDACTAYSKGATPKLGAVVCFSKPGAAGHVAIVEGINSDGSILISESGWSCSWENRWWTQTVTPPNYYSSPYVFQGFIYNPAVDDSGNTTNSDSTTGTTGAVDISSSQHPARIFIAEAESHAGTGGHEWVKSQVAIGNQAWCAATCCAVAKATGYGGKVMPQDEFTASGFGKAVIEKYGGEYIAGPNQGGSNVTPQVGDFICYQKSGYSKYDAYHVGMVRGTDGDRILTVEGNTDGGQYKLKEKDKNQSNIGYYARPDWTKVGGANISFNGTNLYTTASTRADATIREACYLGKDGKPSIKVSTVRLGVINYTGVLSEFVKLFGGASSTGEDNIDGLPQVPREIVTYLKKKGLNTAAGIGVIANVKRESSFETSAVNKAYGAYGLCQWRLDRATAMKKMAGKNWSSNLTGQLDYLWHELSTSFSDVLSDLQKVQNTLDGAKSAAETFVRNFEKPEDIENKVKERKGDAEEYWKMVVVASNTNASSGSVSSAQGSIVTQSGRTLTTGTTYEVPSDLKQTGIHSYYTYYDRSWDSTSTQKVLCDIWRAQGKPTDHKLATINGYYLIATRPKFGLTGTMMTVVLEDNSYFNAIVADIKATDQDANDWGHIYSGATNIIEFEGIVSGTDEMNVELEALGWYDKNVTKIIVYDNWMDGSNT